jgi:hypothetical protein
MTLNREFDERLRWLAEAGGSRGHRKTVENTILQVVSGSSP